MTGWGAVSGDIKTHEALAGYEALLEREVVDDARRRLDAIRADLDRNRERHDDIRAELARAREPWSPGVGSWLITLVVAVLAAPAWMQWVKRIDGSDGSYLGDLWLVVQVGGAATGFVVLGAVLAGLLFSFADWMSEL